MDRVIGQGVVLSRLFPCIRITVVLAAVAATIAGCADSRMAANNASGQPEQPYRTGYGFSSDGPTTDLYTEIFGSSKPAAAPATATAVAQPVQPVTAAVAPQPAQPVTPTATRKGQPAVASAATRQAQPTPPPTQVVQQPVAPQPPPEPDVPTAYGITANGPTTDLFTELFGPRRRDGQ
jgi:hypothetical protein